MSKSVFQRKKAEQSKTLSIKVPTTLYERIQGVKERLEKTDPDLVFNASAICAEALEEAARRAEKELEQLERVRAGGDQGVAPEGVRSLSRALDEPSEQAPAAEPPAKVPGAGEDQAPERRGGLFSRA